MGVTYLGPVDRRHDIKAMVKTFKEAHGWIMRCWCTC
ncbi:MAG: hypothetical protein ACLUD2_04165 [Clostridium sp.]